MPHSQARHGETEGLMLVFLSVASMWEEACGAL